MAAQSNLRGIIYMLISGATFVINDSFMKLTMQDLPPYQTLVMRGSFGLIFALMLLKYNGELSFRSSMISKPLVMRGLFETGAILTYIIGLAYAPIGDVTAIFQTTPLLVILGLIVIYREKTSWLRLALIVIGFLGALLVAQPGRGTVSPVVMIAFVSAAFAAIRDLAARQISSSVPAMISTTALIIMVLTGSAICGLLFEHWLVPSPRHFVLAVGSGLFMMLGHHFTLLAYRNASAQAVAPFYYAFMVFAVISGLVIFGDVPNLISLAGMAVIVVSGLFLLTLEKKPLPPSTLE
ncbi:DMT family transporter [Aestuariivirga litoralis]|uniref:DMT family transporter n=1 Tax=Aestuariivirga litoralis TaxID=2650924 RepID=UPI0018C52059|nr:DMT family transporter [Aestuariivirga litoralis]MBG1232921.1 DMT family transporter [Aestuariivirga litoralis]